MYRIPLVGAYCFLILAISLTGSGWAALPLPQGDQLQQWPIPSPCRCCGEAGTGSRRNGSVHIVSGIPEGKLHQREGQIEHASDLGIVLRHCA